jgi:hypothetical protein
VFGAAQTETFRTIGHFAKKLAVELKVETAEEDASSDKRWQPLFLFVSCFSAVRFPPVSYSKVDDSKERNRLLEWVEMKRSKY